MEQLTIIVADKLNLPKSSVAAVLTLLNEGATIPFIARYRKDKTGAMDEVQIQNIQDEARFQKEFSERKLFIETTITEQQKMTEEIQAKLNAATTLNELEDIYLPYKPKRKTKAQTARENGLQPLADFLLSQKSGSLTTEAEAYLNDAVKTIDEALQGARDIVSETINEDADFRNAIRRLFEQQAQLQTKVLTDMEEKGSKFKDYFAFCEPISSIPSHRILAAMRGFMEGVLRLSISPSEEEALALLESKTITTTNETTEHLKKAIKDGYRRLLQPSLESEFRMALKTRADEEAINVFAENLRQLLLSAPLGGKKIMALDPGYKTGCKVVCLDERGELLQTDLIFIHEKNYKLTDAEAKVKMLVHQHSLQAIAVGDGTAGRETEQFLKRLQLGLPIFLVNEDGASIYSASEIARQEFPDQDVTVRGAVSIGRRLMDPLAELVKIDPKSIGVGQYQHDVNQIRLKERLDQTVESCVNAVGVNLNTASKHLLSYVSGIGPSIAENIVRYRHEHGGFKNRKQLLEVPRLGAKAYEQCAGFLRVKSSDNPLDASAVHPESYPVVQQMAKDLNVELSQLIGNTPFVSQIAASKYVSESVGTHTIQDILRELKKPGLDPRSEAQAFEFADIYRIEDVQVGMIVPGVVTNLTRFGAFIDIGVKQDGLVHVSEISHQYITDPNEALKLNDKVMTKVLEVDTARKRISLSIKQTMEAPQRKQAKRNDSSKTNQQPTNLNDALGLLKAKFKK
ncbi:MAG: RNA-binding transcriptional accessory protein [Bacteroidetes bacterium]|nr:RNA-binding transcriptional accessory protein [Bacteroidota bacterium]MBS1740893.1 RNA-binding transcriptional accessory protein [Bacteroidota bacterium]